MDRSDIPDVNDAEIFENIKDDLDNLVPRVYSELKRLAFRHFKNERPNHTLSPTELVHEVYVVLKKQRSLQIKERSHFLALASVVMRHVLVNYAISRRRQKRGGDLGGITLDENLGATSITFERKTVDIIALETALDRLQKHDRRKVRIVELHFYGGLTFEEIADHMDLSIRTVLRDWKFAKLWLYRELKEIDQTDER